MEVDSPGCTPDNPGSMRKVGVVSHFESEPLLTLAPGEILWMGGAGRDRDVA